MEYDRDRYDAWTWKHPLILHWILNPGLAFNELVLGQRIPQLTLIDTRSEAALIYRQYMPCPHCQAMNPASLYSKTGLGNYAGLVCAECGEEIPSLKNALTWFVTRLTWPVWAPIMALVGPTLLARQRAKLLKVSEPTKARNRHLGVMMGGLFGLFMGVFFIAKGVLDGGTVSETLPVSALMGAGAGLFFGVTMKLFLTVSGRRAASSPR
jgi:hypothetical protein